MTTPLAIRRILFPADFSEASRVAGQTAAALARHFGARLTLVHVVPPVRDPEPSEALRAFAAEVAPDLAVETVVLSGQPAPAIVAYARQHHVDLIVMGTFGRTGVSRALLGSVAEAVVRRAPCRVMTVPATLAEAVPAAAAAEEEEAVSKCLVCATPAPELICERCRSRIRGEALEGKRRAEKAGRTF